MKKLCLFFLLSVSLTSLLQAQSLSAVFSDYLQPNNTSEQVTEGLKQVEALCEATPHEKCNKAKAVGYYLLSDYQYSLAYINKDDKTVFKSHLNTAQTLFKKASAFMPIEAFPESSQYAILDSKFQLESDPDYKAL